MSTDEATTDRVFEALSDRRRRRLLLTLAEDGRDATGTTVEDVAVTIAHEDPETVTVELVHCHLPKLDCNGYVEWDREAGTVSRGPEWTALEPYLSLLTESEFDLA